MYRVLSVAGLFAHASCMQLGAMPEINGKSKGNNLCDAAHAMNIANRYNGHEGKPSANNLGGKGPESGEESIRFANIFPSAEKPVDLVLVTEGDYTPKNSDVNGLENGAYGTVNVRSGTQVKLKYKFMEHATGLPVVTPSFMMTFYDFDGAKLGYATESVQFSGFTSYTIADDTELALMDHDNGSLTVTAEEFGNKHDNPISPLALTDVMKKRAITLIFPPLTEFAIVFKATESAKNKPGGRNLMFGGASSMECPEQPVCDSFECPSDMVQIPFAEFTNGADKVTCCANTPTCMTHTCSQGKVVIANALEKHCAGIECASTDDEQCCDDESHLCDKTTKLSLTNLVVNNLGGQGPDSGTDHTLTFRNVFPKGEVEVDLVISVVGNYKVNNAARNGRKGKFGVLNVKSGNEAGLKFEFMNSVTGAPETVPGFLFSIYDLDTGSIEGTGIEYVEVSGYNSYKTFEKTDILAEPIDASSGIFYGTSSGFGFDNPKKLFGLTDQQKMRLVSYEFPATDKFHVNFGATEGEGGRNLYFRGASSFYCN